MLEGVLGLLFGIALLGSAALREYFRDMDELSAAAAHAVRALLDDPEADLALTLLEDSSAGVSLADDVIQNCLAGSLLGASTNEGSVQISFEAVLRHLTAIERAVQRSRVSLSDVAPPLERHLQALWKHRDLIETFAARTANHELSRFLRRIARLEPLWAAGKSIR